MVSFKFRQQVQIAVTVLDANVVAIAPVLPHTDAFDPRQGNRLAIRAAFFAAPCQLVQSQSDETAPPRAAQRATHFFHVATHQNRLVTVLGGRSTPRLALAPLLALGILLVRLHRDQIKDGVWHGGEWKRQRTAMNVY